MYINRSMKIKHKIKRKERKKCIPYLFERRNLRRIGEELEEKRKENLGRKMKRCSNGGATMSPTNLAFMI